MEASLIQTSPAQSADFVTALHDLLHACRRSQQTYTGVAREAPSAEFTVLFSTLSTERKKTAADVQHMLLQLEPPVSAQTNGHAKGPDLPDEEHEHLDLIHIPDVKQTDTLLHRQALLEACERVEEDTLKHYQHVLQMDTPDNIAAMLREQQNSVIAALQALEAWKPLVK